MKKSKQSLKRVRQSTKKNKQNSILKSKYRTAIKYIKKCIKTENINILQSLFKKSQKIIDIISNKNIFHKNKTSRDKKRIYSLINKKKNNKLKL